MFVVLNIISKTIYFKGKKIFSFMNLSTNLHTPYEDTETQ